MKKITFVCTIILLSLFCNGCNKPEDSIVNTNLVKAKEDDAEGVKPSGEDGVFMFGQDNIRTLCLGDDGIVYALDDTYHKIYEYDSSGAKVHDYVISEENIITSFCYDNGKLYYINLNCLNEYDLEKQESKVLYTFTGDDFAFQGMSVVDDCIFLMRLNQYQEEQMEVRYDEEDEYVYQGEELLCYIISKQEIEQINIPNIKFMNKKNEHELLIYAYDDEGGFYFTTYDINKKAIQRKYYTDMQLGTINDIAYDETLDKLLCANYEGIFSTSFEDLGSQTFMYHGTGTMRGYNSLQYQKGYTYYVVSENEEKSVIRLENEIFIKETPVLKGYTTSSFLNPRVNGYQVDIEEVYDDEMATILLAGDSDYDFAIISSSSQLAENIRRVGAYHPLNSLPEVNTLLNDCFDYIKDAATDENGSIWMVPVELSCPVLIYNQKLLSQYNIDFTSLTIYEKLIETIVDLPKDGIPMYRFPYYLMTADITNKYVANYAIIDNESNFHSDLFRTYLEIMNQYDTRVNNDEIIFSTFDLNGNVHEKMDSKEYYSNILFDMCRSYVTNDYGFDYDQYEEFRAIEMPSLKEGDKLHSAAECYFIIMNPNSKKIKWTESYIEKVCESIHNDSTTYLLKDNCFTDCLLKEDIHNIIANAKIVFEYPYEILSDEMRAYRLEGQSYEETVSEIERKMDMYLNE